LTSDGLRGLYAWSHVGPSWVCLSVGESSWRIWSLGRKVKVGRHFWTASGRLGFWHSLPWPPGSGSYAAVDSWAPLPTGSHQAPRFGAPGDRGGLLL